MVRHSTCWSGRRASECVVQKLACWGELSITHRTHQKKINCCSILSARAASVLLLYAMPEPCQSHARAIPCRAVLCLVFRMRFSVHAVRVSCMWHEKRTHTLLLHMPIHPTMHNSNKIHLLALHEKRASVCSLKCVCVHIRWAFHKIKEVKNEKYDGKWVGGWERDRGTTTTTTDYRLNVCAQNDFQSSPEELVSCAGTPCCVQCMVYCCMYISNKHDWHLINAWIHGIYIHNTHKPKSKIDKVDDVEVRCRNRTMRVFVVRMLSLDIFFSLFQFGRHFCWIKHCDTVTGCTNLFPAYHEWIVLSQLDLWLIEFCWSYVEFEVVCE